MASPQSAPLDGTVLAWVNEYLSPSGFRGFGGGAPDRETAATWARHARTWHGDRCIGRWKIIPKKPDHG